MISEKGDVWMELFKNWQAPGNENTVEISRAELTLDNLALATEKLRAATAPPSQTRSSTAASTEEHRAERISMSERLHLKSRE